MDGSSEPIKSSYRKDEPSKAGMFQHFKSLALTTMRGGGCRFIDGKLLLEEIKSRCSTIVSFED